MVVYVVTNNVNQKQYVGITKRGLEARKREHLSDAKAGSQCHFHNAIRLYGEEAFSWDVVYVGETAEELFEKEIELIAELDTYHNGYNMTLGGDGGSSGESNVNAVITEEQSLRIGWLIENTTMKHHEIAEDVSCSLSNVRNVAYGYAWSHLFPNPPYKNRPEGARKQMDDEKAQEIINMIHETTSSYKEITLICGTTEGIVVKIANGFTLTHLYDIAPRFNRPDGTKGGYIKMDEQVAILIIQEIYNPNKTYQQIADEFGTTKSTVAMIASGKNWTHLYEIPPAKVRKLRKKMEKNSHRQV